MDEVRIMLPCEWGWDVVYDGMREGIPEQYREDVALLDAIDKDWVSSSSLKGVGSRVFTHFAGTMYYLKRGGLE